MPPGRARRRAGLRRVQRRVAPAGLQGSRRRLRRGLRGLRHVRPGRVRPEGHRAHQVRHPRRVPGRDQGAAGGRPGGLRRHRVEPPPGRRRLRGAARHPLLGSGPPARDRAHPRGGGLDPLRLPRPGRRLRPAHPGRPSLRRRRLRRAGPGAVGHDLPVRGPLVGHQRRRGAGQLRLPDGLRPRPREPRGPGHDHPLGPLVPGHHRGGRPAPRRGQAHPHLGPADLPRRDARACRARAARGRRVLERPPARTRALPGRHRRADDALRRAAAPHDAPGLPGRKRLRPAHHPRRQPGGGPPGAGRDVRRQPRLPADAGPGVPRGGLVQAAGLRAGAAAPRRPAVRVRRRLRRSVLHRAALG